MVVRGGDGMWWVVVTPLSTLGVSRVVPHLRGECPVIPLVHWKGVALPRKRSSRTLKTFSNCKGFYSVFSAVDRSVFERFVK